MASAEAGYSDGYKPNRHCLLRTDYQAGIKMIIRVRRPTSWWSTYMYIAGALMNVFVHQLTQ